MNHLSVLAVSIWAGLALLLLALGWSMFVKGNWGVLPSLPNRFAAWRRRRQERAAQRRRDREATAQVVVGHLRAPPPPPPTPRKQERRPDPLAWFFGILISYAIAGLALLYAFADPQEPLSIIGVFWTVGVFFWPVFGIAAVVALVTALENLRQ